MRTKSLLLSMVVVPGVLLAQPPFQKAPHSTCQFEHRHTPSDEPYRIHASTSHQIEALGPILFEEDFSNGLGNWVNAALTGYNANAVWEYRGTTTTPSMLTGSRGAFDGGDPIESPTASTGFAIFDSDYWDNGGNPNQAGNGPAPVPHGGALTSPTIDCSSEDNVILTFYTYLRQFNADMLVLLSNDGFTTQDTVWNGYDAYDIQESSAIDQFIKLDVSDVAGGQSDVQIRFLFTDGDSPTANGTGYYHWQIDDIQLRGAADFDLRLDEVCWRGIGGNNSGLDVLDNLQHTAYYSKVPLRQATNQPITFGALFTNLSDEANPDVQITATVTGSGTFSGSSTPTTFSTYGSIDSIEATTTFTPSSIGTYNVAFALEGANNDDYDEDNAANRSFAVSDYTMSWSDETCEDAVSWGNGTHSMFARMELTVDDTLSSVDFAIYSGDGFESTEGSVVEVGIWPIIDKDDFDLNNPVWNTFVTLGGDDFTTNYGNNAVMISARVDEPFPLPAGEYLVGYKHQSGIIRTALSDREIGFFNAFIDIAAGTFWIENNPIIELVTWSSEICAGSNLTVDGDIICNPDDYTADIDAVAINASGDVSYTWSTGATTEDITVDAEGVYTLTVTDEDFCEASFSFEVNNADVDCNLSTGELASSNFSFSIMPNPNNGNFTLAFGAEHAEDVTVEMQSLKGEVVYSEAFTVSNALSRSVDASGIAAGVYLVKVTGASGTSIQKIMVQ